MTSTDEKLCLQWNDFKENVSSAFRDLGQDKEFTDVTLVCGDGQQVEAHKVVLVVSSPFFQNILMENKHPHPLIYMRGIRSENLMAMVNFFYHGEANVYQENLDSFLGLAEELQLKGLTGNQTKKEEEVFPKPTKQKSNPEFRQYSSALEQFPVKKTFLNENGLAQAVIEEPLAITDKVTNNTDSKILKQQVKSMMLVSQNADPYKKDGGKARICKMCGKEGSMDVIMKHIEAHHIPGISLPCGLCGRVLRTRDALKQHKRASHRDQ